MSNAASDISVRERDTSRRFKKLGDGKLRDREKGRERERERERKKERERERGRYKSSFIPRKKFIIGSP